MNNRIKSLDGLRGILALSVAISHILGGTYQWSPERPFVGAYLAVDMFLILSGFVLTTSITHQQDLKWAFFLKKRFIRLWPTYLACLPTNNNSNPSTKPIIRTIHSRVLTHSRYITNSQKLSIHSESWSMGISDNK